MQNLINSNKLYSLPKETESSILQMLSKNKGLDSERKLEIFGKSIFETVIKFLVETKNDTITLQSVNRFLVTMPVKD